jgi:hypothetical protein
MINKKVLIFQQDNGNNGNEEFDNSFEDEEQVSSIGL